MSMFSGFKDQEADAGRAPTFTVGIYVVALQGFKCGQSRKRESRTHAIISGKILEVPGEKAAGKFRARVYDQENWLEFDHPASLGVGQNGAQIITITADSKKKALGQLRAVLNEIEKACGRNLVTDYDQIVESGNKFVEAATGKPFVNEDGIVGLYNNSIWFQKMVLDMNPILQLAVENRDYTSKSKPTAAPFPEFTWTALSVATEQVESAEG
jgi:hypothetical protein